MSTPKVQNTYPWDNWPSPTEVYGPGPIKPMTPEQAAEAVRQAMAAMEPTEKAGTKHDVGKLRHSLLPQGFVTECLKVLEYGAAKYAPGNWQKVEGARDRYYDALCRHLQAWRDGELHDKDSGLPHLAHVAVNVAFLLWFDSHERQR